jgi:hypothetical protein
MERSATFASLRVHNYRLYAAGGLISNSGTWMGRVAQDWLVLTELTDRSASALGIATGSAVRAVPAACAMVGDDRRPVPQAQDPAGDPDDAVGDGAAARCR